MPFAIAVALGALAACSAVNADRLDADCCWERDVRVGLTSARSCDDIAYFAESPDGECFFFSCDAAPADFEEGTSCQVACDGGDSGDILALDLPDCE